MLKAVKVRLYPTESQQVHLAQAFGCVRWVWNQSLDVMTSTYKETGKSVSAMEMKRKQRKLSRKQDKTTNKRHKAKKALARVHSKIARVREDYLHKLSRKIVNENQVIVVEDLAVKNMVKNHNLAKAISDGGWGTFCTMLKYKAEQEGKVYLEIDRFFPSSLLCSNTLQRVAKMDLSVRMFDCPHCGQRHDRDINAAINIKNEGLRILALRTSATALGGNVRPKQSGRKSTTVKAVADELGSPRSIA
jgi:putative transposase